MERWIFTRFALVSCFGTNFLMLHSKYPCFPFLPKDQRRILVSPSLAWPHPGALDVIAFPLKSRPERFQTLGLTSHSSQGSWFGPLKWLRSRHCWWPWARRSCSVLWETLPVVYSQTPQQFLLIFVSSWLMQTSACVSVRTRIVIGHIFIVPGGLWRPFTPSSDPYKDPCIIMTCAVSAESSPLYT